MKSTLVMPDLACSFAIGEPSRVEYTSASRLFPPATNMPLSGETSTEMTVSPQYTRAFEISTSFLVT